MKIGRFIWFDGRSEDFVRLELYRRGTIIRNQMVFIILSFVYLQIVREMAVGQSALNQKSFWLLVERHQWLFALGLVTLALTYYGKRLAKPFFVFYAVSIVFLSAQTFIHGFDKFILVLNFIYILLSYYFYLFLASELDQSLYRPGFVSNSIGAKCEYDLPVSLQSSKLKATGKLSNWDRESCFIVIDESDVPPRGLVDLSITFEGQKFSFQGIVSTKVGQGIGIRIKLKKKGVFDWLDFYEIIQNRGYKLRFA